jgi:pimeloyl-ACP methyl ester carboxylesterase
MSELRAAVRQFLASRINRFALGILILAVSYQGSIWFFGAAQEWLIFHPVSLSPARQAMLRQRYPAAHEVSLTTADGPRLHGWLIKHGGSGRRPLLLYFGGNADEVSAIIPYAPSLTGWTVATFNYRGYGLSQGHPGERALCVDALAIFDALHARPDIDASRIVVMGRSLGSGVAVYLASQRPVRGVILISPYDSLVNVAKARYPYLPIDELLRHRFNSLARASSIHVPALFFLAGTDRVIPRAHSKRLARAWGGTTKVASIDGSDHNSLMSMPYLWWRAADFANGVSR